MSGDSLRLGHGVGGGGEAPVAPEPVGGGALGARAGAPPDIHAHGGGLLIGGDVNTTLLASNHILRRPSLPVFPYGSELPSPRGTVSPWGSPVGSALSISSPLSQGGKGAIMSPREGRHLMLGADIGDAAFEAAVAAIEADAESSRLQSRSRVNSLCSADVSFASALNELGLGGLDNDGKGGSFSAGDSSSDANFYGTSVHPHPQQLSNLKRSNSGPRLFYGPSYLTLSLSNPRLSDASEDATAAVAAAVAAEKAATDKDKNAVHLGHAARDSRSYSNVGEESGSDGAEDPM